MTTTELSINDRTITCPNIDFQFFEERVWAFPGKAIFATCRASTQQKLDSGVLITNRRASIRRAPVAWCLAANVKEDVEPGSICIVNQTYAKRVKDLKIGPMSFPMESGEIWLFGCASPMRGTAFRIRPEQYLYAKLSDGNSNQPSVCPFWRSNVQPKYLAAGCHTIISAGKLIAGGKVSIKMPDRREYNRMGLVLPDNLKDRPDIALVESVTANCKHAEPGMYVWYQRRALTGLENLADGYAILPEEAIFAAVDLSGLA